MLHIPMYIYHTNYIYFNNYNNNCKAILKLKMFQHFEPKT